VEGHVEIWKLLSNCADDAGRPDLGFGAGRNVTANGVAHADS
jgi:hypothetical protein